MFAGALFAICVFKRLLFGVVYFSQRAHNYEMRMSTDCCRLIQYLAHVQYLLVWNGVRKVVCGVAVAIAAMAMDLIDGVLCK